MSYQQPPEQQRSREIEQQRTQEQSRSAEESKTMEPQAFVPVKTKAADKKASGMKLEEVKARAGASGERNIVIQWTPTTPIDGSPWYKTAYTAGFDVKTAFGNGLEVTLEQLQYRRVHNGTAALRTSLIPAAPLGTKGRVIARDVATGEVMEQPWTWHSLGGDGSGLLSGLWNAIKRLIWNPK